MSEGVDDTASERLIHAPSSGQSVAGAPTGSAAARDPAAGLQKVLGSRRWIRREWPFPHVIARDLFTDAVYSDLEASLNDLIDENSGVAPGGTRYRAEYVERGLDFGPEVASPYRLFFSRPWHDMLAGIFGVSASGYMSGGLHHHAVGSPGGRVHHDLNPGFFAGVPGRDEVVISSALCDYKTGQMRDGGPAPVETIRAVAALFYVANPRWRPGDGGGTGLYERGTDPIDRAAAAIPPINNSLVAFECTPWSFHGFMGNPRVPRNSMVMWIHRPKADVIARWGEAPIVPWVR